MIQVPIRRSRVPLAEPGDIQSEPLRRLADEQAEVQAKDADNQLVQAIDAAVNDPDSGYLSLRGRDAVDAYPQLNARLAEIGQQIGRRLPQGKPRALYEPIAIERLRAVQPLILDHNERERADWADTTSNQRIVLAKGRAAESHADPEEVDRNIGTIHSELLTVGRSRGWSPEVLDSNIRDNVSDARLGVGLKLADADPDVADQYLETYRTELKQADAASLERAIGAARAGRLAAQGDAAIAPLRLQRVQDAQAVEEARDGIDALTRGDKQDPVSVERLAVRADAAGKPALAEQLRSALSVQDLRTEARAWRPEDYRAWIAKARESGEGNHRLSAAETMLGEMRHALATDPLGHAARSGVVQLAPLDLGDASSVAQRIKAGVATGDHFGTRPAFLTSDEVAGLAGQLGSADAAGKARIADQIADGFGRHGPHVLAALAGADPVFAHAASLQRVSAQHAVTARSIFEGQDALRTKAVTLPPAHMMDRSPIGRAFTFMPEAKEAIVAAARALYAREAGGNHQSASDMDPREWERALNRAAGAVYDVVGQRGGFGTYNGRQIVLPHGVRPGEFGNLVRSITDDDLKSLGPMPTMPEGGPAEAEVPRRGALLDAGNGLYFVDAKGGDQDLLLGTHEPYVLDLQKLLPRLRGRR